jgi:phosphatidylethanolamine/phosphatidyl-N-methylethanolamine N-methyltransferase
LSISISANIGYTATANNSESLTMDIEGIKAVYRRYAPIYDIVFGPVLHPGRKLIIEALNCRPGDRILEVGVGTGLSLPLYPKDVRVTGIDISAEMLNKARRRIARAGLEHVDAVLEMNGEDMRFADRAFDKVVAMYVVSVAPDPTRLVEEMCRVCKAGGDIFIVNHFCSANLLVKALEKLLASLSAVAGFRPNLDLDEFLRTTRLEVVETRKANMFGYWKVLRCRNHVKGLVTREVPHAGHPDATIRIKCRGA